METVERRILERVEMESPSPTSETDPTAARAKDGKSKIPVELTHPETVKILQSPREFSAKSPHLSDGWEQPSAVDTHTRGSGADGEHARYRFVVPMVLLAKIRGKTYRLTTHYTVVDDQPTLDFEPLAINFNGRLLWEKTPEQKVDFDSVTNCSTGQGTFTEHSPVDVGKVTHHA